MVAKMPEYKSSATLEEMMEAMSPFLPNAVAGNVKPKRYDAIEKAYNFSGTKDKPVPDLWDRQHAVYSAAKPILISQLLGCNEIIVPIIVDEYKALAKALKELETEAKSRMNQFQEMKEAVASVTCYTQKMVSGFLYDDLNVLIEMGVDVDIKECMNNFKGK